MPILTDRDRQEIRTGRNRTLGAIYAKRLFAAEVVWTFLKYAVPAALVVWFVVAAYRFVSGAWDGGVGSTVSDNWPLAALGALFAVLFLSLARSGSSTPSRRRRRRRRR